MKIDVTRQNSSMITVYQYNTSNPKQSCLDGVIVNHHHRSLTTPAHHRSLRHHSKTFFFVSKLRKYTKPSNPPFLITLVNMSHTTGPTIFGLRGTKCSGGTYPSSVKLYGVGIGAGIAVGAGVVVGLC